MAGIRLEGNTSGNVAEVDANNNLLVNPPTSVSNAGYTALAGVVVDGSNGQWWTSSGSGSVTLTLNGYTATVNWTTSDAYTAQLMVLACQANGSLASIANFQVTNNGRVQIYSPSGNAYTLSATGTGTNVSAPTLLGMAKTVRRIEASDSYRLRVGVDSMEWYEDFVGTTINTGNWFQSSTTMTIAVGSGFLTLNNAGITTTTTNAFVSSYRALPLYQDAGMRLDMVVVWSAAAQTNVTSELGMGVGNTGTTAPTDGAFFRVTGTGNLTAVLTNNSTETTQSLGFSPAANTRYELSVLVDQVGGAWYYVNGVAYANIVPPTSSSGATQSSNQAIFFRLNNTGAAGAAVKMQIASVSATLYDLGAGRSYRDSLCAFGQNSITTQTGFSSTHGSTANYANSAAPSSATLSNTAAGYTTLGGQWQFAAVAGAETDFALFAYQVPAVSVTMPGRTLYITGIRIDAINMVAAVATTGTVLQFGLAVGSTAVSLATAEAAGTKAPRRYTLGFISFGVGAAVGQQGTPMDIQFLTPLVVNQSEYFHIICKVPVGTATATEIFRGTAMVNGYFE